MHEIQYEPEATTDAEDRFLYYEAIQPTLGIRFRRELDERIILIRNNPKIFGLVGGRTRYAEITKFPELILYHVRFKVVYISAVLHGRRDPRIFRKRRR